MLGDFCFYLFVFIDPDRCMNVRVELQGGDGGAVAGMFYFLFVGYGFGAGLLVPGG